MQILSFIWWEMRSVHNFLISMPYIMYLARHQVYVKCQLFISMVEQVENIRFSALNSSILTIKWDCGGPRICLLLSSYLKGTMGVLDLTGIWHSDPRMSP